MSTGGCTGRREGAPGRGSPWPSGGGGGEGAPSGGGTPAACTCSCACPPRALARAVCGRPAWAPGSCGSCTGCCGGGPPAPLPPAGGLGRGKGGLENPLPEAPQARTSWACASAWSPASHPCQVRVPQGRPTHAQPGRLQESGNSCSRSSHLMNVPLHQQQHRNKVLEK